MKHLVFVYGSLLRGLPNHRLLTRARLVGAGSVRGLELYDYAPGSFPAACRAPRTSYSSSSVAGELYEVTSEELERLDRLEGHPGFYRRVRAHVLVGSDTVRAWVYVIRRRELVRRRRIVSGSWRAHIGGV